MQKLLWYFKQLFPLLYYTTFKKENGREYFTIWRMWFGKCYHQIEFPLENKIKAM